MKSVGSTRSRVGVGILLLVLLFVLHLASAAQAQPDEAFEDLVADTMDGLEWGMSYKAVFGLIEERIRDHYRDKMREASSDVLVQDRIINEMRNEIAKVKRDFVVFDGRVNGWDVSSIGPEFRRGSGEAMLVHQDGQSRNYYFFMRGRLWKWYREFDPSAFGGNKFDVVGQALQHRFGPSEEQTGERAPGGNLERWMAWEGERSQLSAIDKGSYVVFVLEDRGVKDKLAVLRRNALPRAEQKNATIDAIMMTDNEREKWRQEATAARSQ